MVKLLPIDMEYTVDVLLRLLNTPSPTGRTDDVMHLLGGELRTLGLPFEMSRRGALIANLSSDGATSPQRALFVHADTLGCMVRRIKRNGRLEVAAIGTFSARSAEGGRVIIFTDEPGVTYTGTILPLKASGHAFGNEIDVQKTAWTNVEVRIDAFTSSMDDTIALGIQIGDFIAFDALPVVTPTGFIKARHLDGKAGVAAALGAIKALLDARIEPPVGTHLLITIAEEVGYGASSGLHADVAETLAIDTGVVAPGQSSTEDAVSVCMQDSSGPMDYHLTRKLLNLARDLDISVRREVYRYYRSDSASALEAGAEMRGALIGFGVDATHGHERTHLDGIRRVSELTAAYLQTPLTFEEWDESRTGALEDFPGQMDERSTRPPRSRRG